MASRSCPACTVLDVLLPHLSALVIERVERGAGGVVLDARVRSPAGRCRCGAVSRRVHGRYVRDLRDGAIGGMGVTIVLKVRRFRCANTECPAVTFVEQVPGVTSPHSRFTPL